MSSVPDLGAVAEDPVAGDPHVVGRRRPGDVDLAASDARSPTRSSGPSDACVSELPEPMGEFMSAWICACVSAVL